MSGTINTARGQITVFQAVQFIKQHPDKTIEVLSYLRQLREQGHNWEARFVARHILTQADHYNEKVVRLAQEIAIRLPVGPKKYATVDDLRETVRKIPAESQLKLTMSLQQPGQAARALLNLGREMIIIPDQSKGLLMAVCLSGHWGHSGNHVLTVTTTDSLDPTVFSQEMRWVLDTIQVVSVPERTPDRHEQAYRSLLRANPDIWYDADVFGQVCDTESLDQEKDRLKYLPDPTLEEALQIFWGSVTCRYFLEFYIEAFKAAVGS